MAHRYEWLTGEPDALKGASPVRGGAVGKGLFRQYLAGRLLHFAVNLSVPTNATIADGQAVGMILDDAARISVARRHS